MVLARLSLLGAEGAIDRLKPNPRCRNCKLASKRNRNGKSKRANRSAALTFGKTPKPRPASSKRNTEHRHRRAFRPANNITSTEQRRRRRHPRPKSV